MASELKVDTIKHTNNTSAITLDTSGNVTLAGSANNLGTVSAGTLGSSVVLPDATICGFTETTTTPTGTQGTDTSYTTLTGSSVDYTPVSGSSFVVYEYQFGFTGRDNNPLLYWQSYYDGSIIANMDSGFFHTWADANAGSLYRQITFTLPSWSGSKNLHIKYKCHNDTYEAKIHQAVYSSNNYIKIYRRTYSVM